MNNTQKNYLDILNDQLKSLLKQLISAKTKHASDKLELQIIKLRKKIIIAEQNKKSGLNNTNRRTMQGGAPGLGKRQ